jgi:hypothetical protein
MALQRTHRPRVRKSQSGRSAGLPVQELSGTGRSLRSLGAPLNAQPFGGLSRLATVLVLILVPCGVARGQAKAAPGVRDPVFPSRISVVSLERKGCYGTCPIYSVTLRNDDGASYAGVAHVDRRGNYTGRVTFQKLGLWLENQPTLVDKSENLPVIIDGEAVVLTIRFRDGKKVSKKFGTGSDRPDLWAAAEVIDGVASKIRWQKASDK